MSLKMLGFIALPLVITLAAGFTNPVNSNTTTPNNDSTIQKQQKKPSNTTTGGNQMTQPTGGAMSNDRMKK